MTKYTVENDTQQVRVMALSAHQAAVKGAIKLGMKWAGRRPGCALQAAPGARLFVIYGPTDPGSNGQHRIGQVWVDG